MSQIILFYKNVSSFTFPRACSHGIFTLCSRKGDWYWNLSQPPEQDHYYCKCLFYYQRKKSLAQILKLGVLIKNFIYPVATEPGLHEPQFEVWVYLGLWCRHPCNSKGSYSEWLGVTIESMALDKLYNLSMLPFSDM